MSGSVVLVMAQCHVGRVTSCHVVPCHVVPCHAVPCRTVPCRTEPWHTPRRAAQRRGRRGGSRFLLPWPAQSAVLTAAASRENLRNAARESALFNNGPSPGRDLGCRGGMPSRRDVPTAINRGTERPLERWTVPTDRISQRRTARLARRQKLALLGGERGATETNVARRGLHTRVRALLLPILLLLLLLPHPPSVRRGGTDAAGGAAPSHGAGGGGRQHARFLCSSRGVRS